MSNLKLSKSQSLEVYRPDGSYLFTTESQEVIDTFIAAMNLLQIVKDKTGADFSTSFRYVVLHDFTLNL